jgi:chemotaxis protein CheZ
MKNEAMQEQVINTEVEPVVVKDKEIINRIGHVTRTLHDSLSSLGLDKIIERVTQDIPDARDRLNYVARMTEQAAERVLNATDAAIPLQTELSTEAQVLKQHWKVVQEKSSLKGEYSLVSDETLAFLTMTEKHTTETKVLLMDIMMAQDFQDLTGQVIKKIITLTQDLERQLVQVLIDFSPASSQKEVDVTQKETNINAVLMNGPQVGQADAVDIVASQVQVDDLLESLGF